MKKNILNIFISLFITLILGYMFCFLRKFNIFNIGYLIVIFSIIYYILFVIDYLIKKRKIKEKIKFKEIVSLILFFVSLILIGIFILVLDIDYLNWYAYSSPFYINVIVRIIEFIVPSIILMIGSILVFIKKKK